MPYKPQTADPAEMHKGELVHGERGQIGFMMRLKQQASVSVDTTFSPWPYV